jgi:P-loop ATPase protein family
VAIVTLLCDERNIEAVARTVEAQGYRRSVAQSLHELTGEVARTPDLAILVTGTDGATQVSEMDDHEVRYWLVGVGAVPEASWSRLRRKPHALVPSADANGGLYLAQLLDDWRVRQIPRIDLFHFSFRSGVPPSADWVIDVRFLESPYWVPALRTLDSRSAEIARYVTEQPAARVLLTQFTSMLTELLPSFVSQGRTVVRVGVGCTGGEHRSNAMAEALVSSINTTGRAAARHVTAPPAFLTPDHPYALSDTQ